MATNNLRTSFFQHLAQTSENPPAINISHGEHCFLYDTDGRQYIDLISGITVSSLGHNNSEILEAVSHQLHHHLHVMVYGEYILSPQVKLAEKLASLLPENLSKIYFTNSGAEAVEGAMKLAKRFTGKTEFISCKDAYHGSTQGALSLMGNETYKQSFRPLLPDVRYIEFNNIESLDLISNKTAAVFTEPVQSETGYIAADPDFMYKLRAKCDECGALLVFDEAQSGIGRTGKLFGFQHYGITPDILILAKALGGGFPLGAFIASAEIMDTLMSDPPLGHLTTFGGHPVSCTASLAAINIISQNNFLQDVHRKGNDFKKILSDMNPGFKITGKGLMLAIHFDKETNCEKVIHHCLLKGLITDWFLFAPHALRLSPPLVISDELLIQSAEIISESIRLL
jgi:acetylornithine/N-succinyldiaminopimelate aminotransferase